MYLPESDLIIKIFSSLRDADPIYLRLDVSTVGATFHIYEMSRTEVNLMYGECTLKLFFLSARENPFQNSAQKKHYLA